MKKLLTSLLFLLLACGTLSAADVTTNLLTSALDNTDLAVYTTASVSPASNNLLLLTVAGGRLSDALNAAPTVAGNGLTWVLVASDLLSTNDRGVIAIYRAMGASPSTGVITITFSQTQFRAGWILSEFSNVDTGGSNGADAVVQSAVNKVTATSVTVTLAAFGDAKNATFGGFSNAAGGAMTEGAGFTEIADLSAGNAAPQTIWRIDNDTTVNTSNGTSADKAGVALEIKFLAPAGTSAGARGARLGFTF